MNFVIVFNSVLNIYWSCSWTRLRFVLVGAGCFSSSKNDVLLQDLWPWLRAWWGGSEAPPRPLGTTWRVVAAGGSGHPMVACWGGCSAVLAREPSGEWEQLIFLWLIAVNVALSPDLRLGTEHGMIWVGGASWKSLIWSPTQSKAGWGAGAGPCSSPCPVKLWAALRNGGPFSGPVLQWLPSWEKTVFS